MRSIDGEMSKSFYIFSFALENKDLPKSVIWIMFFSPKLIRLMSGRENEIKSSQDVMK